MINNKMNTSKLNKEFLELFGIKESLKKYVCKSNMKILMSNKVASIGTFIPLNVYMIIVF